MNNLVQTPNTLISHEINKEAPNQENVVEKATLERELEGAHKAHELVVSQQVNKVISDKHMVADSELYLTKCSTLQAPENI